MQKNLLKNIFYINKILCFSSDAKEEMQKQQILKKETEKYLEDKINKANKAIDWVGQSDEDKQNNPGGFLAYIKLRKEYKSLFQSNFSEADWKTMSNEETNMLKQQSLEEIKEMCIHDKTLLTPKYNSALTELTSASNATGKIVDPVTPGLRSNGSTIDFIMDLEQQTYNPLDDIGID